MHESICHTCNGSRLNPVANAVRFHGYGIQDLSSWSVNQSVKFFKEQKYTPREEHIGKEIFKEIKSVPKLLLVSQIVLKNQAQPKLDKFILKCYTLIRICSHLP